MAIVRAVPDERGGGYVVLGWGRACAGGTAAGRRTRAVFFHWPAHRTTAVVPDCRAPVTLRPGTVAAAMARLPGREGPLGERHWCLRDAHHEGQHHAELGPLDRWRSLFVRWDGDGAELAELTDCPSSSPGGMDGCSLFEGHSEPHTWEHLGEGTHRT
ncbi:hypothetical protein [Streptomyces sp. NPDC015131]|uniref:hypothetical protein n=1 Tax=Streptomyces sp. NPDC015131 TaxID=3364941 RepID=UPI003701200A